jgi:hypothetical protein
MSYSAIVALTLSLLVAPTLPAAARSADALACDLRVILVAPYWPNTSTLLGINDWRETSGGYPHDSTGLCDFYLDRSAGDFVKSEPSGSGTANLLIRAFPINSESYIPGQYLDISGVNHDHSLTENAGRFLNPIDRPGAGSTNSFSLNDQKNMAEANVNSTNNLGPAHFPSDHGGESKTLHPPESIDTVDLSGIGGIVGTCLNVGSSLINDNLSHLGGDSAGVSTQRDVPPQTATTQNLGEGDRRHTIVIRCFGW